MKKVIIFLGILGGLVMGCEQKKRGECNSETLPLSQEARIFHIRNFLTSEECDYLISLGEPELQRSTVVNDDAVGDVVHEGRTSRGMFLTSHPDNAKIKAIEARIAALTKLPSKNGETIQVLHYQPGEEYRPHYDTFDAGTEGGQECLARGGQRIATLIMYLNSPSSGGETIFPKLSLAVKPRKGDALLFYTTLEDGAIDMKMLHGGAPVLEGEKWIATKWIREHEFH